MEETNGGEERREEKKGRGKPGRPSKAKLLERERSWIIGSRRSIDEFFKKMRGRGSRRGRKGRG